MTKILQKRYILATLAAIVAALLPYGGDVFAVADPDSVQMTKALSFTNVLETADVLFLGRFEVNYNLCGPTNSTGCPSETISQTFLGNLIDDDGSCTGIGTTHLRSISPATSTAPGLSGYTTGVFSVYLTASEASTLSVFTCPQSHALEIEGNPGVFADITQVTSEIQSENPLASALIASAVLARASELETAWGVDLLQASGSKLNTTGQDYFEAAIPNLRLMAPTIFPAGIISPEVLDREFNKGYKTDLENFGVGTALFDNANSSISSLSSEWGFPEWFFKLGLSLLLMGAAFVATVRATGDSRIGLFSFVVTMATLTLIGFVAFEIVAIITVFAAVALGWMFFLKDA